MRRPWKTSIIPIDKKMNSDIHFQSDNKKRII